MRHIAGAVLTLVVAPLVACSASPETPHATPRSWDAVYSGYLEQTDSEYVREMLADLRITGDEYSDALSRIEDCVNGAFPNVQPPPFAIIRGEPGQGYNTTFRAPTDVTQSAQADEVINTCFEKYGGIALAAYDEQLANPQNFDRASEACTQVLYGGCCGVVAPRPGSYR